MPTRRGWAVLAAAVCLWLAARLIGSPDLHMVAAGLLALPLLGAVYIHWNRVRLRVGRHLSAVRVFPGTPVTVSLTVRNEGPGAASFLLLQDEVPSSLGGSQRSVVSGIPAGKEQTTSYAVTCRERGRYVVGPLSIFITDPFGMCRIRWEISETSKLIVYPAVEEIEPRRLTLQGAGAGESAVRQLQRSADEFYTMREYVTGDDLRRIHWPSVARTGRLMIRQDEATRRSIGVVFLDNRAASLGSIGSQGFEKGVSAAAATARRTAVSLPSNRRAKATAPTTESAVREIRRTRRVPGALCCSGSLSMRL